MNLGKWNQTGFCPSKTCGHLPFWKAVHISASSMLVSHKPLQTYLAITKKKNQKKPQRHVKPSSLFFGHFYAAVTKLEAGQPHVNSITSACLGFLWYKVLKQGDYPEHKQAQICPTLLLLSSWLQHLPLLFLISMCYTVQLRSLLGSEQEGQDKPLELTT